MSGVQFYLKPTIVCDSKTHPKMMLIRLVEIVRHQAAMHNTEDNALLVDFNKDHYSPGLADTTEACKCKLAELQSALQCYLDENTWFGWNGEEFGIWKGPAPINAATLRVISASLKNMATIDQKLQRIHASLRENMNHKNPLTVKVEYMLDDITCRGYSNMSLSQLGDVLLEAAEALEENRPVEGF